MVMIPRGIEPLTFGLGTGLRVTLPEEAQGPEQTLEVPSRPVVHSPATTAEG